jgi:hypothetical protein
MRLLPSDPTHELNRQCGIFPSSTLLMPSVAIERSLCEMNRALFEETDGSTAKFEVLRVSPLYPPCVHDDALLLSALAVNARHACAQPTRGGVNLVSFSFPILASSGIDAEVGSRRLVEEVRAPRYY